MHFTPAILELAYELVRATPPFKGWKLPPGDQISFHVSTHKDHYGNFACFNGRRKFPKLEISNHHVKSLSDLILVMAHEMVHLRQSRLRPNGQWNADHAKGPFVRMADQVCRHHKFNRSSF